MVYDPRQLARAHVPVLTPETLAKVMQDGRRVLIVGSPPGTFDETFSRDPLLLLWPSTEASSRDTVRMVPSEVGAVLLTNMLSHDLSRNVRQQAQSRGLLCSFDTISPGAAKRLIKEARASLQPPTPEIRQEIRPVPTPSMPKPKPVVDDLSAERLIDDCIAALQLVREKVVDQREVDALREKARRYDLLTDLMKQ